MKILRLLEKALPLLFWIFLIFAFDTPLFGIMTITAAVIHEIGHLLPALMLGKEAGLPRAVATGLRISLGKAYSYKDELSVTLGGPAANIITVILLIPFNSAGAVGEYLTLFAAVNAATAISNLLPLDGHDGYSAIKTLILMLADDPEPHLRRLDGAKEAFSLFLLFLSLYLILKLGEGYPIFALFFSYFLSVVKKLSSGNIF